MKRVIAALVIGVAILAGVYGLATSLGVATKTLGAGKAAVTRCDSNGVSTLFNYSGTSPNPIISVTVSGIASGCGGQTLKVTVTNASTNSSGSIAVPAGGGSVTVTLSASITESDSTRTDLSIA